MIQTPLSSYFLSSAGTSPPLRIGLLVDGPLLDRAAASVIRDVLASDFARIEIALVPSGRTDEASRRPGSGTAVAAFRRFRGEGGLVFAMFAVVDRWRAGRSDDPLEPDEDLTLLAAIPSLLAVSTEAGNALSLSPGQTEQLRAARLDIIVQLGSSEPGDAVRSASRHGVWALHHSDDLRHRGGPGGLRALVDGNPLSGVALVRLADGHGRQITLDRGTFATDLTSLARTRRTAIYGSTHLVIRNLRLLHERGWDWLETHRPADPARRPGGSLDRPTDRELVRWLVPLAARRVGARLARAVRRTDDVLHWRIAIRVGEPGLGLDRPPDLTGFRWVESPAGHYYADPFVVERDGRTWLFFEDYSYARGQAVIACAEIDAEGKPHDVREVLGSSGHLSYPMMVTDGGDALMIPESAAEAVVRVHRAIDFPDRWTTAGILFAESAMDTSVWFQDGRWWFFTTVNEPRGGAGMLLLFHATTVSGPWTAHPLNPISQDVRFNRGGGSLFMDGDRLVRPSQDGSRGYGYSLRFNEITSLSEDDYAERPGTTIAPVRELGLVGIHTYNRAGAIEVIDGKVARARHSVA